MEAKRFVLTIMLGNDAMRTWLDLADALHEVSWRLTEEGSEITETDISSAIRDKNGNRVGSWHTDKGE